MALYCSGHGRPALMPTKCIGRQIDCRVRSLQIDWLALMFLAHVFERAPDRRIARASLSPMINVLCSRQVTRCGTGLPRHSPDRARKTSYRHPV
jgi:hypothetical protein